MAMDRNEKYRGFLLMVSMLQAKTGKEKSWALWVRWPERPYPFGR
jgi:hypothetical protein